MSIKTESLFSHSWTTRISDPGEEGAHSHLFETTDVSLVAQIDGQAIRYVFTRKVEGSIAGEQTFTDLTELFTFMSDYLEPVSLGLLGVKIGKL